MSIGEFAKELERKALYLEELEKEIANDLNTLTDRISWNAKFLLINDLETKLNYAENQWLNIWRLKKEFLDFRLTTFVRDIEKKIEEIKSTWSYFNTNTTIILTEYKKLQNYNSIDLHLLKEKVDFLESEIKRWRLLLKVKDVAKSWWTSVYSLEEIEKEYLLLKNKWFDVLEVEEILFEI